jgi:hypothetical protein
MAPKELLDNSAELIWNTVHTNGLVSAVKWARRGEDGMNE